MNPRSTSHDRPPRLAAALAVALLALGGGCRDERPPPPGDGGAGVRRYTVRGEIVRMPAPSAGVRQVSIRHEAIDDFANEAGAVVGMGSMVMPFDVAEGVSLDGVGTGDKVEVQLAVSWSPPSLRIEQLRKLPAETALHFGAARPKADPPPR